MGHVSFLSVTIPSNGSVTLSLSGAKLYGFTSGNGASFLGGLFALFESSQGAISVTQSVPNAAFTYDASTNYKLTITNTKGSTGEILLMIMSGTVSIDS